MKTSFRAFVAVALLAGYYVLAVGLVVGLVALDVGMVLETHFTVGTAKLLAVSVPVVLTLFRGVFMIGARSHRGEDDGEALLVTEAEQPELWASVRRIAVEVGTRAPDEIRLVPIVNAGVTEKTRLLGLLPGRRLMIIGSPLLAGLSEPELDAILAHELGHYANRDTRLSGVTYRGRVAIGHTIGQIAGSHGLDSYLARVFRSYAKLYMRISQEVCRRQEYAADAAAVRVAGAAATASALRQLEPLKAAWTFFQSRYAFLGVDEGYLPSGVMAGFTQFLAEPSRQAEMREIAANTEPPKPSPYDSHPPTNARLAAILGDASGDPGEGAVGVVASRPARDLLRDGDGVLEASFDRMLNERGRSLTRLDWEEFVHRVFRDATAKSAEPLLSAAAAVSSQGADAVTGVGAGTSMDARGQLQTVLVALEDGGAAAIGARLPGDPVTAENQRVRDEFLRGRTRRLLDLMVDVALADAGKARWVLSWSAPAQFVYAPELTADTLGVALDAAVSRRLDVEPLRGILETAGVSAPSVL